jgi:hypothetical protein
MPTQRLLSAREVALVFGVHPDTVTRWARQEKLYSVRVVDEVRVPAWVLDEFCTRPRDVPRPVPASPTQTDYRRELAALERKYGGETTATTGAGHANGTKKKARSLA